MTKKTRDALFIVILWQLVFGRNKNNWSSHAWWNAESISKTVFQEGKKTRMFQ